MVTDPAIFEKKIPSKNKWSQFFLVVYMPFFILIALKSISSFLKCKIDSLNPSRGPILKNIIIFKLKAKIFIIQLWLFKKQIFLG